MRTLIIILSFILAACTTSRKEPIPDEGPYAPAPVAQPPLLDRLGMRRAVDNLGYTEKYFKQCETEGQCRPQYLSVVHFQLLCRDSEGTVSHVPVRLTPLTANQVRWQLGDQSGVTRTDAQGFGQLNLVSEQSMHGQRLILRIGKQFMGFSITEVSKVILPKNFCL